MYTLSIGTSLGLSHGKYLGGISRYTYVHIDLIGCSDSIPPKHIRRDIEYWSVTAICIVFLMNLWYNFAFDIRIECLDPKLKNFNLFYWNCYQCICLHLYTWKLMKVNGWKKPNPFDNYSHAIAGCLSLGNVRLYKVFIMVKTSDASYKQDIATLHSWQAYFIPLRQCSVQRMVFFSFAEIFLSDGFKQLLFLLFSINLAYLSDNVQFFILVCRHVINCNHVTKMSTYYLGGFSPRKRPSDVPIIKFENWRWNLRQILITQEMLRLYL